MPKQQKRYNDRQHIVNIVILQSITEINNTQELADPDKFFELEISPLA